MASLSGMVTGANAAFHGALDELSALKTKILGGILSIPIVTTVLVTASHIIVVINVLKIIKKLPTSISSLQTELLTIAGLAVGTAAYTKALATLEKSELGKAAISKGHDIGKLVSETRDMVNTATDAVTGVKDGIAIARGVVRNAPNLVFDAITGEVMEVAQEALLTGEDAESEEPLKELPLNTRMMELRESNAKPAEETKQPSTSGVRTLTVEQAAAYGSKSAIAELAAR